MPDTPRLTIAIVEDDIILREELSHFLSGHGHIVHALVSGTALDDVTHEIPFDIIILDLNLPGESGFEIAKRYRKNYPSLGIVILSARTATVDRIGSYEQGADIYIPKPCPPGELFAAIRGLARRVKPEPTIQGWQLDTIRHVLSYPKDATTLELLAVESTIIRLLAHAPGHQLNADDLCVLAAENGPNGESAEALTRRALENKISRLRKKFAQAGNDKATLIRSIRGEGYQLCIPVHVLTMTGTSD
jgi:DNA-binding response OmpR family regulator